MIREGFKNHSHGKIPPTDSQGQDFFKTEKGVPPPPLSDINLSKS